VVTIANPKSMFFLAAFFPQFVNPAAPPALQFTVLGVTFLAITYVFTALWALAAGRARHVLRTRSGVLLRNRISGSLMIGAGLGLALARRA
jgi:threonine/homoserine/homoserine lactone efflux protein